jgi:hypothetical protein
VELTVTLYQNHTKNLAIKNNSELIVMHRIVLD